ncbi:1-acyl-sn-glycerol-3-phosphate acyltransferase [Pararhodonellum marinum]|uniref:1-acyl-sn-glycerol-3-phosphate acyltransferase n=1 Tax=Pararhodonellum marinum TaxID=2755358 RepID=UPI00188F4C57|nr:1-acyl-sn-glycerol-3-phosphate acyltransferase [Pararhodonellum marinum]
MKNTFNHVLRLLTRIALHGYFSKISVKGLHNIPKNRPILFVVNHQNALIDPILIATETDTKPHFLTRASVFQKYWAARMLDYIRMFPVYRVRDGIQTIKKNEETFEKSFNVLAQGGTLLIFPEGTHHLNRTLKPLSKGFTRIALGIKEKYPDQGLIIVPVGINYSAHQFSGSKVGIQFGKGFESNEDSRELREKTFEAMKALIVFPDEGEYANQMAFLKSSQVDLSQPELVKKALKTAYEPAKSYHFKPKVYLSNILMKLIHFPLWLVWKYIQAKIKDPVFYATFKFLVGFVGIPLLYFAGFLLAFFTGKWTWFLTYVLVSQLSIYLNRNDPR